MNSSDIKNETKSDLGVQKNLLCIIFPLNTDPLGYLDIHKWSTFFSVALSYNNSEKKDKNPPFQALQKSLIYMSYE